MEGIERALEAAEDGDLVVAIEELLASWREHRHPAIADAIDRLDARTHGAPPGGKSVKERRERWAKLAEQGEATDVRSLCASIPDTTWKASVEQLRHLHRFGSDPRIAMTLARAVRDRRWSTRASEIYFERALRLAVGMRDVRAVEVLPESKERWGFPRLLGELREQLAATEVRALSEAQLATLARIAPKRAARGREALFQAVYDDPRSDDPRAILADLLVEEGDPRGRFVQLQLDGTRAALREASKLFRPSWMPASVRPLVFERDTVFERGFLAQITLDQIDDALHDPCLATVERVHMRMKDRWRNRRDSVTSLFELPWFCALRELHLPRRTVAASGPALDVQVLSVTRLDPEALTRLPQLHTLRLFESDVDGLRALVDDARFARVHTLHVQDRRIDDAFLASLPTTVKKLVLEPYDVDPFGRTKVRCFERVQGGWKLTMPTSLARWYRGPTEALVELQVTGTKASFTAEIRERLDRLVQASPHLMGQSFPWQEAATDRPLRPTVVRFELGSDGSLEPPGVIDWLQTRPFGYAYDTLHANVGKPRRLQKDAVAHVERYLTKSSHRDLTLSADGREYERSFCWNARFPDQITTDGDGSEVFRQQVIAGFEDLMRRTTLLWVQTLAPSRPEARPPWRGLDFDGWLSVVSDRLAHWLPREALSELGRIEGVEVMEGAQGVFVFLSASPEEQVPVERQAAVVDTLTRGFMQRFEARFGDVRAATEQAFADLDWTWRSPLVGTGTEDGATRVNVRVYDVLVAPKLAFSVYVRRRRTPIPVSVDLEGPDSLAHAVARALETSR